MTAKSKSSDQKNGALGCGLLLGAIVLLGSFAAVALREDIPDEPQASAKMDAVAFYRSVIGAGTDCDKAFTRTGQEIEKGDPVSAYRFAEAAKGQCLSVGPTISKIEVPVSVGKIAHAKLTAGKQRCSTLYVNKWASLGDMLEVLDGGGSVAKAASLQSSLERIQSDTILCVTGLSEPLLDLGVDLGSLKVE